MSSSWKKSYERQVCCCEVLLKNLVIIAQMKAFTKGEVSATPDIVGRSLVLTNLGYC